MCGCGSAGRAGYIVTEGLAVRGLAFVVQVKVSLGKKLNPLIAPIGLAAPCMAAASHQCVVVCTIGRMRGHCLGYHEDTGKCHIGAWFFVCLFSIYVSVVFQHSADTVIMDWNPLMSHPSKNLFSQVGVASQFKNLHFQTNDKLSKRLSTISMWYVAWWVEVARWLTKHAQVCLR